MSLPRTWTGEMRPQSAKSKGRRLQQRVAASILEAFPHLSTDDVVSTSMGAGGEDVRMSARARQCVPLSIECKCHERLNIWAAVEQATRNAPQGSDPCVVFSRNRSGTYVAMPWDVLLALLQRIERGAMPPRLVEWLKEASGFIPD